MQPSSPWAMTPLAEFDPGEFAAWQELLETRSGLVVEAQRRTYLQTMLGARLRELGLHSYAEYRRQLGEGPRGAFEWACLMDRLTVQETRFFRHPPSFACVATHLRALGSAADAGRAWQLWSVGCASGEEAYALALLAAEAQQAAGLPTRFGVTGSDLSRTALERARCGRYRPERLGGLSAVLRQRHFAALTDGDWQVRDALRQRCCFVQLNVLDLEQAPQGGMDVIFCQNLLIYFRRWRRREVLARLVERLRPGGLLVIGVGEMGDWHHPQLQAVADNQVLAFTRKG